MAKINRTYDLTITTLTPLHIGSGNTLLMNYDYVTYRGGTWVINEDALAEMLISESASDFERMVSGAPASDLLRKPDDFQEDSDLFRYVMRGEPRATTPGAQLQELLKDAWDRPYIPGSSLKGALRTAVGFYGWVASGKKYRARELNRKAKFAAQPMENEVLYGDASRRNNNPNYDLMRALQVRDSAPDDTREIRLLNVSVVTPKNIGSPIEIEAIPQNKKFSATLAIDDFLRKSKTHIKPRNQEAREVRVRDELGLSKDQSLWLANLAILTNQFTLHRLENEVERWQHTEGMIRSFYSDLFRYTKRLVNNNIKDEFIIQLGWGGGWDSKTFGSLLTDDEQEFSQVVNQYKRQMLRQGDHKPGDRYPKSRRLVMANGKPMRPMGWIKVEMERRE